MNGPPGPGAAGRWKLGEPSDGEMDAAYNRRDPQPLLGGGAGRVFALAQQIRADSGHYERIGQGVFKLDLQEWTGHARVAYQGAANPHAKRWFDYCDLCVQTSGHLEDYAHTLDWAARQDAEAGQRWREAARLEGTLRDEQARQNQPPVMSPAVQAVIDKERRTARQLISNGRREVDQAARRLHEQLGAVTASAPEPRPMLRPQPAVAASTATIAARTSAGTPAPVPQPPADASAPPLGTAPLDTTAYRWPGSPTAPGGGDTQSRTHTPSPTPAPAPSAPSSPTDPSVSTNPNPTPAPTPPPTTQPPTTQPPTTQPPITIGIVPTEPAHAGDDPARDPLPPRYPSLDPGPGAPAPRMPRPDLPGPPAEPTAPAPGDPLVPDGGAPPPNTPGPADPSAPGEPAPPQAPPGAPSDTGQQPTGPATPSAPDTSDTSGESGTSDLATTAAVVGGTALATAGAVLAVRALRHRRSYEIGSGERDDYLAEPPEVTELPPTAGYQTSYSRPAAEPMREQVVSEPVLDTEIPEPPETVGNAARDAGAASRPVRFDWSASGGVSLLGAGAPDVARARLVGTLANTPRPGQVVMVAADTHWLLELRHTRHDDPTSTVLPERLRLMPDLGQALSLLVHALTQRARLDEPTSERLLLVLPHPPTDADQHDTLAELLLTGRYLGITAVILGDGPTGCRLTIAHDRSVTAATGPATGHLVGTTLDGLSASAARAALDQLAHTGHTDLTTHATTPETAPASGELDAPAHDDPADEELDAYEITETESDTADDAENPKSTSDQQPAVVAGHQPGDTSPADSTRRTDSGSPALATPAHTSEAPAVSPGDEAQPQQPPGTTDAPLRLCVLGPPTLRYQPELDRASGTDVDLGPKLIELLVFLALHPNGAHRDNLAETLWPDTTTQRPTNSLNSTRGRLRRALAKATDNHIDDIIHTKPDGTYHLNTQLVTVDLHQLTAALTADTTAEQRHRDCTALYRGELGERIDQIWILTPREDLRRDVLDTAARAAQHHLDTGQPNQALTVYEHARTIDPHNESIYRHIIRIQTATNQHDAAQRTLTLLAAKLGELGQQPSAETLRLFPRPQPPGR